MRYIWDVSTTIDLDNISNQFKGYDSPNTDICGVYWASSIELLLIDRLLLDADTTYVLTNASTLFRRLRSDSV